MDILPEAWPKAVQWARLLTSCSAVSFPLCRAKSSPVQSAEPSPADVLPEIQPCAGSRFKAPIHTFTSTPRSQDLGEQGAEGRLRWDAAHPLARKPEVSSPAGDPNWCRGGQYVSSLSHCIPACTLEPGEHLWQRLYKCRVFVMGSKNDKEEDFSYKTGYSEVHQELLTTV